MVCVLIVKDVELDSQSLFGSTIVDNVENVFAGIVAQIPVNFT